MNEDRAADFLLEMLSAPWQPESLEPFRVPCNGLRPDGRLCGESALVHDIEYVGPDRHSIGQQGPRTQYVIECPRCGRRTQVQG